MFYMKLNSMRILHAVFLCFLLFACSKLTAQKTYEEFIEPDYLKTVTLYAYSPQDVFNERFLNPPVVNLANQNHQLVLEFDDLRAEFSQYKIKIVHCETDWTQSRLLDMEFLGQINELFLNDFQISQSTKVPYYHYRFLVPKPKISGNFVLQLFDDDNLIMEKKFWVYENTVDILADAQTAHDPEFWKTHQQLNVKLELGNYRVGIPHRELKVMLRMNQNLWKEVENKDLINSGRNSFTLQQFGNEYLFPAGNEYRFLDVSSSFRRGQSVKTIELGKPDLINTLTQGKRVRLNYTDSYDNDGGFIINNLDGSDRDITSDYVEVVFELEGPEFEPGKQPVLYGKLTNWQPIPMEFSADFDMYQQVLMLKNGVYDFAFAMENELTKELDVAFYEGDFNQTGNTYEVFVYHTIPGRRYSSLIGYQLIRAIKR
jgi:hypothetical protein